MSGFEDEQAEEVEPVHQPTRTQILSMLDGSVQSQGIKVSHRDWLDMGSEGWQSTPDNVKAAAYQAALATGWVDGRLVEIMLGAHTHLTDHMMKTTMEFLQQVAADYPLHIEIVNKTDAKVEVRRHSKTPK